MSLKKLGRYDLVRVLGKGAMGIVYEGRDPNLERRVAIKTVKVENLSEEAAAEYESRFRTEARSAARLQHPNIVSVYDSDRDGDIAFLVMEYIQGDDLKHHLDKGVRYSLDQSLKMVRDLLSALDYAHKQGIVHRDIKPANLLIEPGGRVKLTDFGVARIQDSGEATRTQGSMVGTLKYMSPEQVQGQKIDSRADLFSVGVVLYQLLTDKRPFDGDNDFSIIHQIIGHTPPSPTSFNGRLPAAIDAVVARALAKDRDQRFATARDFATALQSAIRRAEDATIVPPADPQRKPDAGASGTRGGQSIPGSATSGTSGSIATVTQELELVYWKDIKDSADPQELDGFLARFPEGIYADLARRRLRKLASGSSGDQTTLSSPSLVAVADQDMEATRLRSDLSQPRTAAPAPAGEDSGFPLTEMADYTRTVVEPRPDDAAAVSQPEPVAASSAAAAPLDAPAATPPASKKAEAKPPQPAASARKPALAVLAGIGALAVAGLAAVLLMGKNTGQAPLAAASAPQAVASQPASQVAAASADGVPGLQATMAAAPAAQAASVAAPAASAARKPASAPRPKRAASSATLAVSADSSAQSRPAEAQEPKAQAASAPRLTPPSETCKDKVFLSRQFCLQEECAKPVFHNAPACVKLREEAKLREDSKIRN
ncbi:serine/threonine-protein kinase [uncultured Ramlibacter sp.]|uniref:serine/threonine-protein kinase n=1 Tax=uncultured Ramlibacter sp. TaxID=260755 RepID=UPI00262907AA|nr:serine/threonine-protein kinase [uncultured Ramlibacter sp.]